MSERDFHLVFSAVVMAKRDSDPDSLDSYRFVIDSWDNIDERFEEATGVSLSPELHKDIVDMEQKGYVLRDPSDPMIMCAPDFEFLHGIWYNPSLFGGFEMVITGRRQGDGEEEIGGEIADPLGTAGFFGGRTPSKIRFTKKYDKGHHRFAGKGDIAYQGRKEGVDWVGSYTYMDHGEILKTGKFILTGKENDLPEMKELLRRYPL